MVDTHHDIPLAVEQCVFHEHNVFFYQIPRHASTSDPRAEHWSPDAPLLTGSLKIVLKGDGCSVRLFEPPKEEQIETSTVLFAQCPIIIDRERNLSVSVQDCADSSRYFVLRVVDECSKRHAFIGIGFPERPTAFNFKACLQDYVRYRHRQMEAELRTTSTTEDNADKSSPKSKSHDYSLPKGQVIHVNLKGGGKAKKKPSSSTASSSFKLAPPPGDDQDLDEWGDFTSA